MTVADNLACTTTAKCTTATSCCASFAISNANAIATTPIAVASTTLCWPTGTAAGGKSPALTVAAGGIAIGAFAYAIAACPVKAAGAQGLAASAAAAVTALYIM